MYIPAGVISGALLYIRDDFKSVDKQTVLQVINFVSTVINPGPPGAWTEIPLYFQFFP